MKTQARRSSREIEDWIVAWIGKEAHVAPSDLDVREQFVNLGLSSRQAILLSGELADWLDQALPPTLVWDHPTIEKLANYLAETI